MSVTPKLEMEIARLRPSREGEGKRKGEYEQGWVVDANKRRREGGREGGRARTLPGAIGVFLEAADAEATQRVHHAQRVNHLVQCDAMEGKWG